MHQYLQIKIHVINVLYKLRLNKFHLGYFSKYYSLTLCDAGYHYSNKYEVCRPNDFQRFTIKNVNYNTKTNFNCNGIYIYTR